MAKKINSEYVVKNTISNFNILLGTSNKKKSDVIYTTLSSYITPTNEDIDEEYIVLLDKQLKKYIKSLFAQDRICEKDFIVVVDIATNRMTVGKPTFLDVQIYFKPLNGILIDNNYNFKKISEKIYQEYVLKIVKFLEREISEKDFILSKTKTIYTEI